MQLLWQQHWLRLIRRNPLLPLGLALAVSLIVALSLAPTAAASVRCHHTGAPTNELRVLPYEDPRIDLDFAAATVRRAGNRILVFNPPFETARQAVRCAGPRPTGSNTESILFLQSGLSFTTLDLSGGLPAPRTEFRSDLGALGYGIVKGTDAADEWTFGGSAGMVGLNVDPSRPDDLEVTWDGLGTDVVVAEPGAGDDTVDATGLQRRHGLTIIQGGAGADTLLGSAFRDALSGGRGRDVLAGGSGSDELDGRDREHDKLDCGAGRDAAQVGRGDSVSGCERVSGPRRG